MFCCIEGCNSHSTRKNDDEAETITFHRFPSDAERKLEWIRAINPSYSWTWKQNYRVCSKHFSDECFCVVNKRQRIRMDSIPSLYLVKKECNETVSESTSLEKFIISESLSKQQRKKRKSASSCKMFSKSTQTQFDNTGKLKKDLEKQTKMAKRRLLRINCLRKQVRRLVEKNKELYFALTNLFEKDKIRDVVEADYPIVVVVGN